MPPGVQSICPSGQFYSEAADGCRDCGTICDPQYGGRSAECLDKCPDYGHSTLSYPFTTASVPSITDLPDPGSNSLETWLIIVSCVASVFAVACIIALVLFLKKKCRYQICKTQQQIDAGCFCRPVIVTEETDPDHKSRLVVSTPVSS